MARLREDVGLTAGPSRKRMEAPEVDQTQLNGGACASSAHQAQKG